MDLHPTAGDEGPLRLASRVPPWADGLQLLDYLVRRFPYQDRKGWQRLLAAGKVLCNGRPPGPGKRVHVRDEVAYLREQPEPPANLDVRIVHADADLVVAYKPAHLPSHADGPFIRHTFVHQLRRLLGTGERLHLVHRLDRETSGLLAVTRNAEAGSGMEVQFRTGTVRKVYLAVVRGVVAADSFVVDAPIGLARPSAVAIRRAVVAPGQGGVAAATAFEVVERLADCTLLRAEPRTGRTHQIRVHLEHVGHPLVGDRLYGRPDADYLAFVAHVKAGGDPRAAAPGDPDRHLLHAGELAFAHPRTGSPLRFLADLPADLASFLEAHRAPSR